MPLVKTAQIEEFLISHTDTVEDPAFLFVNHPIVDVRQYIQRVAWNNTYGVLDRTSYAHDARRWIRGIKEGEMTITVFPSNDVSNFADFVYATPDRNFIVYMKYGAAGEQREMAAVLILGSDGSNEDANRDRTNEFRFRSTGTNIILDRRVA